MFGSAARRRRSNGADSETKLSSGEITVSTEAQERADGSSLSSHRSSDSAPTRLTDGAAKRLPDAAPAYVLGRPRERAAPKIYRRVVLPLRVEGVAERSRETGELVTHDERRELGAAPRRKRHTMTISAEEHEHLTHVFVKAPARLIATVSATSASRASFDATWKKGVSNAGAPARLLTPPTPTSSGVQEIVRVDADEPEVVVSPRALESSRSRPSMTFTFLAGIAFGIAVVFLGALAKSGTFGGGATKGTRSVDVCSAIAQPFGFRCGS